MRSFRRYPTLVAALVFLGSLAPETAGAQEWHELYADGKQALRNGQAARAAQLLRGAIQKRPQPGVAVPAYGTNFEPQYFPYLRLAEAYFRLDAYDDALKVLETSARFGVEPAPERAALENRVSRLGREAGGSPTDPIAPAQFDGNSAYPPAKISSNHRSQAGGRGPSLREHANFNIRHAAHA